ncbi:MAG: chromate transporter [Chitinophagaceae bacterium]|nr:chromate transporter [Rubrivivax sp.]
MFRVFTRLALQGFGGVLPVAQRMLVERQRWLSPVQFVELLAVAQILPGPNVVNLSLIVGDRFFGWRGALAAMGGMLLAPLAVVLALAALASQLQSMPAVAGALRGMGVVAAGLVAATAWKLAGGLKGNPLGWPACAAFGVLAAVTVGVLRWPLPWVLLLLGSAATAAAWWRIRS